MDRQAQLLAILILAVLALILVLIIMKNSHRKTICHELEDIHVRFNKVKTVPLSFKLTKARAVAKIEEAQIGKVEEYYAKYEEAQKHLDQLQELINGIEDSVAGRKYSEAKKSIAVVQENLKDSEEEVAEIDAFLDRFVEKENEQRDYSNLLKERFREIKLKLHEQAGELVFASSGLEEKIERCGELFSSSEDWMYGNEFASAQKDLEEIDTLLQQLQQSSEELPELLQETKGIIPVMMDELQRRYALSMQRQIYLKHLDFENVMLEEEKQLKECLSILVKGECLGVAEKVAAIKKTLHDLNEKLEKENDAFSQMKKSLDFLQREYADFAKIENYLQVIYQKEKDRYSLQELSDILPKERENVLRFEKRVADLQQKVQADQTAPSVILSEVDGLLEALRKDKDYLRELKGKIDNTANGEQRAKSQVTKLQLVLNEITIKIRKSRLPAISASYEEDLRLGYEYVEQVQDLLAEIPLRIEKLNTTLDEAIDFIYRLYNNVNNVVGMATMVENTIVYGNKYRSSYPELDRELSRAELIYLNGEYTQALRIALAAMKSLFPQEVDSKLFGEQQ